MVVVLKNTFFQICIVIVLTLIIFNLAVAWINTLGVFQTTVDAGITTGSNSNATMSGITDQPITSIWDFVLTGTLTGAAAAGLVLTWLTRSTTILGIWIFSVIFWAAYLNTIGILELYNYIPIGFILIGTVGMLFIWAAAIAGMLSGSG